jgi:hypothetical protein
MLLLKYNLRRSFEFFITTVPFFKNKRPNIIILPFDSILWYLLSYVKKNSRVGVTYINLGLMLYIVFIGKVI